MNAAWGLVSQSAAERLGWGLVHSLWQGAVLAVLYAFVRVGIRRCSANTRYLAGCAMLVLLFAAPVLTALYGPFGFSFTSVVKTTADTAATTGTAAVTSGHLQTAPVESVFWSWALESADLLNRSLPSVVTAWLVGVVVLACRWIQGCWWVRRVRTVQVEPVDAALVAVLEYLKCRFEIQLPVRLVRSALADVPMVVGWLRPVILLPASALTGLTLEQLES
ncbi:MAG: M56 family metallopeptidase, partial [Limisphaerales bacterium]